MAFIYFIICSESVKKIALSHVTLGLIFALASMTIMILAPGNKVRQAHFPPPPSLINLIDISAVSKVGYLKSLFANPTRVLKLIGVFLSSAIIGSELNFNNLKSKNKCSIKAKLQIIGLSLIIILPIIFVCFIPSAY